LAAEVATSSLRFTRADYERLPEDFRVELIEGGLLKMTPPTLGHQEAALRICEALRAIARDRTFMGPVGVLVDDENVLVPDVVVLRSRPPLGARYVTDPLLVVEVLSPSTADRDRGVKAGLYLRAGADEVWLVDLDAGTAEVRRPEGGRTFRGDDEATSGALPGFRLVPSRLLAAD